MRIQVRFPVFLEPILETPETILEQFVVFGLDPKNCPDAELEAICHAIETEIAEIARTKEVGSKISDEASICTAQSDCGGPGVSQGISPANPRG